MLPEMVMTAPRAEKCPLLKPPAKVSSEPVPGLLSAAVPRASLLSKDVIKASGWLWAMSVPLPGPDRGKEAVDGGQLLCACSGEPGQRRGHRKRHC